MSTNTSELASKDFAQQCINSLADIKRSMPKTWKTAIQPYKDEIATQLAQSLHKTILKNYSA